MRRRTHVFLIALAIIGARLGVPVIAAEQAQSDNGYHAENFELDHDDLSNITSQVMEQHPLLSSSPGVKYAGATRHRRLHESADIIYYPHVDRAGIKEAFQVSCSRQVPEKTWKCDEAKIRRYLRLESQHFEVRVTGPIESKEALALIEATRRALPSDKTKDLADPPTAIMILPNSNHGGYFVTWGTTDGKARVMMKGKLIEGADSEVPDSWQVNVFSSGTKK